MRHRRVTSFGLNELCRGSDFGYRIDRQEVLDWIDTFRNTSNGRARYQARARPVRTRYEALSSLGIDGDGAFRSTPQVGRLIKALSFELA